MVRGRICAEHHSSEVRRLTLLARSSKRRERHRTSIVDTAGAGRRAEIVVPVGSIHVDTTPLTQLGPLRQWFPPASAFRDRSLGDVDDSVSVVLDDLAFVLYIGGIGGEVVGTHDGRDFTAAARTGSVDVYMVDLVDVRRAGAAEIDSAAASGRVLGGSVRAFTVHTLDL